MKMNSRFIKDCPFDAEILHFDKLGLGTDYIAEIKAATYIGEFCLKSRDGGWANTPVAVFYQETPHPRGSNHFGIYFSPFTQQVMIADAKSIVNVPITGLMNDKHEIIYSAYRHDCQELGGMMIDGGRDYTRHSSFGTPVQFKIDGPNLVWVTQ